MKGKVEDANKDALILGNPVINGGYPWEDKSTVLCILGVGPLKYTRTLQKIEILEIYTLAKMKSDRNFKLQRWKWKSY